jgi:hypothetical protein
MKSNGDDRTDRTMQMIDQFDLMGIMSTTMIFSMAISQFRSLSQMWTKLCLVPLQGKADEDVLPLVGSNVYSIFKIPGCMMVELPIVILEYG